MRNSPVVQREVQQSTGPLSPTEFAGDCPQALSEKAALVTGHLVRSWGNGPVSQAGSVHEAGCTLCSNHESCPQDWLNAPTWRGWGRLLLSVLYHLELLLLYLLSNKEPTLRRGLEVCDGLSREMVLPPRLSNRKVLGSCLAFIR